MTVGAGVSVPSSVQLLDRVEDKPLLAPATNGKSAPRVEPVSSRLGIVFVLVGAGLFVMGMGNALAYLGHDSPALPMFNVGLVTMFVPCAWRLTTRTVSRRERVIVSLVLGVGLLAAYYIRSPLIFDGFDELQHGATLNSLLDGRTLLVHNTLLPVSPYYPGLELLTVAVKWVTGLPLVLTELVVLLAVRVVLVLCVFLVVERVCGSARAGGVGVLVYASNPQFFTFDTQYAYETLALALAVATVHLLLSSLDDSRRQRPSILSSSGSWSYRVARRVAGARRDFVLALLCIAALVVTHHLTAWLTAGVLAVWTVGLWVSHRRDEARLVGVAATTAIVLCGAWTAFVGSHLVSYLGPIFTAALAGFGSAIGQLHSSRQLFHTTSGLGASAPWQIVVMLAAAACWCLMLCPATLAALRRRTVRGGLLRFLPIVVAAGYPIALLTSLSSNSEQVGQRAVTFVFFGMAIVVGGWLATRISSPRRLLERGATVVILAVCFLGSMIYGSGPEITLVPGHYLVGADDRSFSEPSLAVAQWASSHLPARSNVAVDVENGALLAEIGHVNMVTAIGGMVNTGSLFFDKQLGRYELTLIRKAHIRYIVTDLRLATSLPLFGTYIEPGESKPGERLTTAELTKFASIPGVRRIYDNGPIQVYDVSSLLGRTAPRTTVGNYGDSADATNPIVLSAAFATLCFLVFVRSRRRRNRRVTEKGVVRTVVVVALVALVFSVVFIPSRVPPTVVGLFGLVLCALAGLVWWMFRGSLGRHSASESNARDGARRSTAGSRTILARLCLCLGVALAAAGLLSATAGAARQWQAAPAIWLSTSGTGKTVVDVQLGPDTEHSYLAVTDHGRLAVTHTLRDTGSVQHFVLPASAMSGSVKVLLVTPQMDLAVWD